MTIQTNRGASIDVLLRIGWIACISLGIGVAAIVADGSLPSWFRLAVVAMSASAFGLAIGALIIEFLRQEADLEIEREHRRARLPRQVYVPTKPPDPKDGGETPTPEFLEILFANPLADLPPVRDPVFVAARLNANRVQAMYTRMATWQAIEGRVQGVSSGRLAKGWTLAGARARMILERSDYGVIAHA